jgi:aspartate ammonia-lyase
VNNVAKTRTEHDLLGDLEVPAEAYYGVQTARALENFRISGVELKLYPNLIKAFADGEARRRAREL